MMHETSSLPVSSIGGAHSSANAGAAIKTNARASADFVAKLATTQALLAQAARDYAPESEGGARLITQASSLGAEDMVISHLINQLPESLANSIGIFVLETGQLHAETLQVLAELKETSRAPVDVYHPLNEQVVQFVAREGKEAMYKSIDLRKACCGIRKMEPLDRALTGKKAWITGLRREQSGARAEVPLIDTSDTSDAKRVKLNPLADWTWGDVWHYISVNNVAYNPLHDQFFPSIGCAPCTRAISLGEDFRAGRWWWEDEAAKECGLHVAKGDTTSVKTESNEKATA
jgi:phosphoadenosine phosphosulfate reductase